MPQVRPRGHGPPPEGRSQREPTPDYDESSELGSVVMRMKKKELAGHGRRHASASGDRALDRDLDKRRAQSADAIDQRGRPGSRIA